MIERSRRFMRKNESHSFYYYFAMAHTTLNISQLTRKPYFTTVNQSDTVTNALDYELNVFQT